MGATTTTIPFRAPSSRSSRANRHCQEGAPKNRRTVTVVGRTKRALFQSRTLGLFFVPTEPIDRHRGGRVVEWATGHPFSPFYCSSSHPRLPRSWGTAPVSPRRHRSLFRPVERKTTAGRRSAGSTFFLKYTHAVDFFKSEVVLSRTDNSRVKSSSREVVE